MGKRIIIERERTMDNIDLIINGRVFSSDGPTGGFQEKYVKGSNPFVNVKLSTGYGHTLLLDINGKIHSYGESSHGQLGHYEGTGKGYVSDANPIVLPNDRKNTRFVSIASARRHSVAIDDRGNMWVWGKVMYPKYTGQPSPSQDLPFDNDDTIFPVPQRVRGLTEIVDAVCGSRFVLALDKDGVVWKSFGFSSPDDPQDLTKFEKITGIPPISKISAGARHALLLQKTESRADKEQSVDVYVLGSNKAGQLGNPDFTFVPDPIKLFPVSWCKVVDISCGSRNSFITDNRGAVWVSGSNKYGCLGFNPDTLVKTIVPYFIENKSLYYKRIVLQRNRGTVLTNEIGTITHIGKGTPANISYADISARYTFDSPKLFAKINKDAGLEDTLESKSLPLMQLYRNRDRILIEAAARGDFNVAEARKLPSEVVSNYKERILNVATAEGELYVSGFFASKQEEYVTVIGDYRIPNRIPFGLRIISIFGGYEHSLMIAELQSVWAFGSNTSLQCGQSINIDRIKSPLLVELPREYRFNIAEEIPDDPEAEAVVTMNDFNIISAACGPDFSVFVTTDGNVWVCGKTSASIIDGSIFKSELQKVPSVTGIIQASAGKDNVALIDSEGNLHVSGFTYSEPTLDDTISRYSNILLYNSYGIPEDSNTDGAKEFVQVSCGEDHLLVTDDKGGVWGIGSNAWSQLGVYSEKPHFFSTPVKSNNMKWGKASQVYCNGNSSFIFDTNLDVWIIGNSDVGKPDRPERMSVREGYLGWRAPSLDKMNVISTGYNATLFLNTNNEAKVFGDNRTRMLCVDPRVATQKPGIVNTPSKYWRFEFSSPDRVVLEKVTVGKKRSTPPSQYEQDSFDTITKSAKRRMPNPVKPSSKDLPKKSSKKRSKVIESSEETDFDMSNQPKSQDDETFDDDDVLAPKSRLVNPDDFSGFEDSYPPPSGTVRKERKDEEPLWESSETIPTTRFSGTSDDPMPIGCNMCPNTHRYRCNTCHHRFHLGGICHIRHLKTCRSPQNECNN